MVEYQIPDSNYPDGFQKVCQHYTSDIELTTQNGDITVAEAQILYGDTIEELLESAGYSYTKDEVDEMIAQLDLDINTYSKAEIDEMIANVEVDAYTKSETDTLLDGKADSNSVYTKTESDNKYLTAQDISQLANRSEIPTKTSQLQNDSSFISDARYVHTDNNYTTTEKNKLSGIASGAEVNVQSDWNVTNTSSDAYIKNKPTIPTVSSSITGSNQTNPVQGGAIYDALQEKAGYKEYTSYQNMEADIPSNGTIGYDEANEVFYIYDRNNGYWRKIENDLIVNTITSGSTNAVTGGAIYTALTAKAGYKWYASFNDMTADNPANGTIGFDSDNEDFYIYNNLSQEWKPIDQSGGVQSNWNETNTSSMAYIQNKPTIPRSTSDLNNDSGFIADANYVHTDNNYTTVDKNKLTNTYTKSEVDDLIDAIDTGGGSLPSGVVIDANYVHTDNNYTTADKTKLIGLDGKQRTVLQVSSISTSPTFKDVNGSTLNYATASSLLSDKNKEVVLYYSGSYFNITSTEDFTDSDGYIAYTFSSVENPGGSSINSKTITISDYVDDLYFEGAYQNKSFSQAIITNAGFGQGYTTQNNTSSSASVTATFSGYAMNVGGIVVVKFTYDVPANATLNITSKGAKPIYYRDSPITAGVIKAGDTATFMYSTNKFILICNDRWGLTN